METNNIELTPEQKGMLASLAQETGGPVNALIDKALEDLQEQLRAAHENGAKGRGSRKKKISRSGKKLSKPPLGEQTCKIPGRTSRRF